MARPRETEIETVLRAAARRLAVAGIAATSVDDVAEAAGVSRATVYRYVGGKDEIVRAVIREESVVLLDRLAHVLERSATVDRAVADVVAEALVAIGESPVLARLSTTDLRETLPFVTVDAGPLVGAVVDTLGPVVRRASFPVADAHLDEALEELTRFVLTALTTPRRDGTRLDPPAAGARAAALVGPLLSPADRHA